MGGVPKPPATTQKLVDKLIFIGQWVQILIKQTAKKLENAKLRAGAVCAVGWEPNPDFTPVLAKLEEAYNRCGWKVVAENHYNLISNSCQTHTTTTRS